MLYSLEDSGARIRSEVLIGSARLFGNRSEGNIPAAISPHADVCLLGMTDEPLEHAQPGAVFADHCRRRIGSDPLISDGFQEFSNPETAGISRSLERRQSVIGADHLVAESNVRARSEEESAVVRHVLQKEVWIAGHYLNYLMQVEAIRNVFRAKRAA